MDEAMARGRGLDSRRTLVDAQDGRSAMDEEAPGSLTGYDNGPIMAPDGKD
jgi:hypothetical protein